MTAAQLFLAAVSIVIAGWLWFYVVRPILEDFGIIRDAETVNTSQQVVPRAPEARSADDTDRRTDRPSVSADNLEVPRLRLDRTKAAVIEVLVYNGWATGEIRTVLKGDNGPIGAEVDAARKRLGIEPPDRTLKVRDASGERVIPY